MPRRVLVAADVAWRKNLVIDDPQAVARDREIDSPECDARRERLDDRHATDLVCHALVGMTGDDGIERSARQLRNQVADLGRLFARREVGGIAELRAPAAGVDGEDDHGGPAGPKLLRLRRDGRVERRNREADGVAGDRRLQRAGGRAADDPDTHAGGFHEDGGLNVRPSYRRASPAVDEIRGHERKSRLCRARFQRTPRIVGRRSRRRPRAHRAEIELVVADRGRRVSDRVVGVDDRRALVQVRFKRPLKHVAGVDHQHGAAIAGSCGAQVLHEPGEHRESPSAIARHDRAVAIVGADDRQRDPGRCRGRLLTAGIPQPEGERRQQRQQKTAAAAHRAASTAHSRIPAENSFCCVISSLSPDVVTGVKATRFTASLATP